jgi:hypothetical protein
VGTVPLIEALRDIVSMEHLIAKASIPLCCVTMFTSIMIRPNIEIDRGIMLVVSTEMTSSLWDLFRGGAEANQELLSRWLQISRRALWGFFSVFDHNEYKGWGYRTSQIASIFTLETMAISRSLTHINKIQDHNFHIFSDARCVTAISS